MPDRPSEVPFDATLTAPGRTASTARAEETGDATELPQVDPARYAIGAAIARGGMGRILRGRDRRLGRPVAIKEVIATSMGMRRRFEREVRVTARLQHPSIVTLYEAGRWPGGEPFYAMRLVEGRSLKDVLAADRKSVV